MTNQTKTQEEKARDYLKGRIENANKALTLEPDAEDGADFLHQNILAATPEIVVTIELSWGGPADGFLFYFNGDKELEKITYYFSDWGTYDEITLSREDQEIIEQIYGEIALSACENYNV